MHKARKEIYIIAEDLVSYGGMKKLYRSAKKGAVQKVSCVGLKQILPDQQSDTIPKPARRHSKRNHTYLKRIGGQWHGELADMQALRTENKRHKYIMTVIDIFSKRAWAISINNKSGKEKLTAFQQLFKDAHPRKPARLQTDAGKV